MPHRSHARPGSAASPNRLPQLLDEIRQSAPRAEAKRDVTVSAPHARSAYLSYTRLSGPRDAVLAYAAYLFAECTGRDAMKLDLDAIERDENGTLTLLLSRSLYEPPEG